jgi:hypothetical protein
MVHFNLSRTPSPVRDDILVENQYVLSSPCRRYGIWKNTFRTYGTVVGWEDSFSTNILRLTAQRNATNWNAPWVLGSFGSCVFSVKPLRGLCFRNTYFYWYGCPDGHRRDVMHHVSTNIQTVRGDSNAPWALVSTTYGHLRPRSMGGGSNELWMEAHTVRVRRRTRSVLGGAHGLFEEAHMVCLRRRLYSRIANPCEREYCSSFWRKSESHYNYELRIN